MQILDIDIHSSATKTCRIQRHWRLVRAIFAYMLLIVIFTFIIGLQASVGQPASKADNDPPWPAPVSMHIVASSFSYGE